MIVIKEPTCAQTIGAIRAQTKITLFAKEAHGTIHRLKSRVEVNRLLGEDELKELAIALLESLSDSCSIADVHAYQQLRLVKGQDHHILIIEFLFKLPEEGSNAA